MPKNKKRGKGNRADKEKPLLSVQGILRLEKTFVTEQHEGAEEMEIRRSDNAPVEKIKLVPGQSEHDLVEYKKGYDIGPMNPLPQNEQEEKIFKEQRKLDDINEAFEDMKKKAAEEKQARFERFVAEGKIVIPPPGTEEDEEMEPVEQEPFDPDDPKNYLPPKIHDEPAYHNDSPLSFGFKHPKPLPGPSRGNIGAAFPGPSRQDMAPFPGPSSDMFEPMPGPSSQMDDDLPPGDEQSAIDEKERQIAPQVMNAQNGTAITVSVDNEKSEEMQNVPDSALPTMKPIPESKPVSEPKPKPELKLSTPADMAREVALAWQEEKKKELLKEREERIKRGEIEPNEYGPNDEDDRMLYSLDEITYLQQREDEAKMGQGPEISETQLVQAAQENPDYDPKVIMEQYWQFVKENPQDFNGWAYLIQHVESLDIVDEIRNVYNAFLPLFPYCYAYWSRYSDIEKKHENWQRALKILHRGLQAIPLSIDLWIQYLDLFRKMYQNDHDKFEEQCEQAIMTVGLDYRSDALWERYIDWELDQKNYRNVTNIYRRLIGIPTRLYNKHWDNFIAHIRDHHPRDILEYDEYEELRKITCKDLDLKYRPDPMIDPERQREVVFPEDKLKAGMKERLVAYVVNDHERCEEEVDKRYKFEEKIKRTYFHVKPMDQKQLKNWDNYLDFEISEGDHERIVVLFERCLIPCAYYEQFWGKYARYLEEHYKDQQTNSDKPKKTGVTDISIKKARWAFGTGLNKVDEVREKRSTWTLRGWKETDEDGNEIMVAEEVKPTKGKDEEKPDEAMDAEKDEENDKQVANKIAFDSAQDKMVENKIDSEMSEVLKTSWTSKGSDAVRDVYKRACIIHCPKKAMIKMKWAAFEEECKDYNKAREILTELKNRFPLLLECRMQFIDMERRMNNFKDVEKEYRGLIKRIDEPYKAELTRMPKHRKKIRTWVAMKYARFLFKVCSQEKDNLPVLGEKEKQKDKGKDKDKEKQALGALKKALDIEPDNPKMYAQIIDICYQRPKVDIPGVTAAIELALNSKHLTNMQKLEFVKRKVEFMQEFGDVKRYRDAVEQLREFRKLCSADLKIEAKKKKDLDKEELKENEKEKLKAQILAEINMKAKIAESEGRLLCSGCQGGMYPNADGVYEFERFNPAYGGMAATASGIPDADADAAAAAKDSDDEDGVVDLLDMVIPEDQEEEIKKTLEEKTKYKEVAPTWELNIETYGYGKKRKTYDPDYEHVESAKFKEYERLEVQGYDDEIKDPDRDKLRNIPAPGLGFQGGSKAKAQKTSSDSSEQAMSKYTTSDYIIPPKVPQMQMGPGIGPIKPTDAPGIEQDTTVFELPPEIADLQKSPCVNVPEWFVKEGGELCLSDTANGTSVIRYWPKFLSEKGNHLMFKRLRKYCKWHQKQVKINSEWRYETRLVAWYGPCDYNYSGLSLDKNPNWAPELLDLLHRLMAMTRHDYNSCFLNLYRHGHDMCGWHADVHPQLGRNPPVASVSLGATRVFEFRKKTGAPNFIRFPLFPGSLLLMEGATQEDWLHSLPRDANCKEERINLTFRIMYSIDKRQ